MKEKTVLVLPGCTDTSAVKMFQNRGWNARIVGHLSDIEGLFSVGGIDAICFMGGTDVDPAVYGEERGPTTQTPDKKRDAFEVSVFNRFKDTDVYLFGICRGFQLLAVLNGDTLHQEVGYHGGDQEDSLGRVVSVCHHQGVVISKGESFSKSYDGLDYSGYWETTKSFGVQHHPEWSKQGEDAFFEDLVRVSM